jgi:hypothetical protein
MRERGEGQMQYHLILATEEYITGNDKHDRYAQFKRYKPIDSHARNRSTQNNISWHYMSILEIK